MWWIWVGGRGGGGGGEWDDDIYVTNYGSFVYESKNFLRSKRNSFMNELWFLLTTGQIIESLIGEE